MEIRQLRYFLAVVRAGSISAAAVDLRMAQPPLSVALRKLEASVGAQLLVRTHRGTEPTSAGKYLVGAATRIVGEIDGTRAALARFATGTRGAVSFAAVPILMWRRVPRLLRRFGAENPDVDVSLIDPPPWTALEMLDERRADVAAVVAAEPALLAQRHGDRFDLHDWGEVPMRAVLPPDRGDAAAPLDLTDLAGQTLLVPQRTPALASVPEVVDEVMRARGLALSMRTGETIQTILPLIESGAGVGLLPDPDRSSLTRFDVVTRDVYPPLPSLRAMLLTRPGGGSDPSVARLLRAASAKPLVANDVAE